MITRGRLTTPRASLNWMECWWIIVPLLSFGVLSAAPFFLIAARTRYRRWAWMGAGWLALTALQLPFLLTPSGPNNWNGQAAAMISVMAAVGATAHLAAVRREYLRRLQIRRRLLAG